MIKYSQRELDNTFEQFALKTKIWNCTNQPPTLILFPYYHLHPYQYPTTPKMTPAIQDLPHPTPHTQDQPITLAKLSRFITLHHTTP